MEFLQFLISVFLSFYHPVLQVLICAIFCSNKYEIDKFLRENSKKGDSKYTSHASSASDYSSYYQKMLKRKKLNPSHDN